MTLTLYKCALPGESSQQPQDQFVVPKLFKESEPLDQKVTVEVNYDDAEVDEKYIKPIYVEEAPDIHEPIKLTCTTCNRKFGAEGINAHMEYCLKQNGPDSSGNSAKRRMKKDRL